MLALYKGQGLLDADDAHDIFERLDRVTPTPAAPEGGCHLLGLTGARPAAQDAEQRL
jgi:hypothetical protein